jgi:ATP phosphoribosyltransferase regulatory subunit
MVHQPPVGARDLLPLDVAQKRWIEDRLQQVFQGWGYHRIITSTLERLDTLVAGGAVQPSTVIQLQHTEDEALGLRPELTASIARTAVTRMGSVNLPQRLYYIANVFRRAGRNTHNRQQEYYQAGIELLGAGQIAADAEILLLLADCLNALNLGDWHLLVGNSGLTRSLLSAFPEDIRPQVRQAIAHLDRLKLESLPLSPELQQRALLLLDLRGRPEDVLQQVSALELSQPQRQMVNDLKALLELLQASGLGQAEANPSLVLDLSLISTFDYYTGIVFEAISSGNAGQRVLGQGGRYDQLLGLYHPQNMTYPGIGFSLNIEDLHQVLLPTGQLPQKTPASHWLVVPKSPQAYGAAFAYARKLREANHEETTLVRVEVNLDNHTPDQARTHAQQRQISKIAWIDETGNPEVESV